MAEQKFEEALKKLENIVDDLEGGELNLDDAIKKYEEGMRLSGFCNKKLQEIQKKVEILIKDASGKVSAKEFNTTVLDKEETSPEAPKQKQRPTTKKRRPKGEELLF